MHLDVEHVQRLLHGELARPAEAAAREHVEQCADCRARVDDAEREEGEVDLLLHHLDHPVPRIDARTIALRARGRSRGPLPWAAGIVVALGVAGAAYAFPGSPLREWIQAAVQRVSRSAPRSQPDGRPVLPQGPAGGGIAVAPGRHLIIRFTSAQRGAQARVSLTDSGEVIIRAPSGAATYTSGVDLLVIDNAGLSTTFEIEIPRDAVHVEIWVSGDRIFVKDGPRLTSDTLLTAGGPYVLPLAPRLP